jgi:hypothetical protein
MKDDTGKAIIRNKAKVRKVQDGVFYAGTSVYSLVLNEWKAE